MYLSHNIVNFIVNSEVACEKIKIANDEEKLKKLNLEKEANILFYFSNDVGISITLKEAEKLIDGKKLDTKDFRGELISNIKKTMSLVNSISETEKIRIDSKIMLQINQSLAQNTIEDWKIKYREENDTFTLIFDDLLDLVPQENKNINAVKELDEILSKYNIQSPANFLYRTSMFLYELLQLQPFIAYNKFTICLMGEMLLSRYLGIKYNIINLSEFFSQQRADILKAFSIEEEAQKEVAWHEMFLKFISDKFLLKSKKFSLELNSAVEKIKKPFLDLNKRQLKILKYLQTIPTVKREDYVEMMDVSSMTAYRDLQGLLKNKLIKTYGKGRGTKYMLASR